MILEKSKLRLLKFQYLFACYIIISANINLAFQRQWVGFLLFARGFGLLPCCGLCVGEVDSDAVNAVTTINKPKPLCSLNHFVPDIKNLLFMFMVGNGSCHSIYHKGNEVAYLLAKFTTYNFRMNFQTIALFLLNAVAFDLKD